MHKEIKEASLVSQLQCKKWEFERDYVVQDLQKKLSLGPNAVT